MMATMSITRNITISKEDFEKIQASEPTNLLLEIVQKNNQKVSSPSLTGLQKLVK